MILITYHDKRGLLYHIQQTEGHFGTTEINMIAVYLYHVKECWLTECVLTTIRKNIILSLIVLQAILIKCNIKQVLM